MSNNCTPLLKCLCCDNTNLYKILDLQNQPLANSYLNDKNQYEEYYPLAVNYCKNCTHLQLTHAVNPDLLFKNYLYVSGTTKTLKKYFDDFVEFAVSQCGTAQKLNVLDIACNDGTQLDSFKQKGHYTYGVDPAENLYITSSKNHEIVCDYFNEESASKLSRKTFDVIIAQNVFAHNSYPKLFLEVCKNHLSENGKLFIQTSQADMVKYGQFDTIYHEHISFFSVKSMVAMLKDSGLYLQNVIKNNIHGNSYVFVIGTTKSEDEEKFIQNDYNVDFVAAEHFASMAQSVVNNLKQELSKHKDSVLIGYGAAAKGNTLLNFGQIDLDYIVDDNPLKHNLFTPGRKIPIISLSQAIELVKDRSVVWVPLSWNFFNEIKKNIKSVQTKPSIFIKYFPEMEIIVE